MENDLGRATVMLLQEPGKDQQDVPKLTGGSKMLKYQRGASFGQLCDLRGVHALTRAGRCSTAGVCQKGLTRLATSGARGNPL